MALTRSGWRTPSEASSTICQRRAPGSRLRPGPPCASRPTGWRRRWLAPTSGSDVRVLVVGLATFDQMTGGSARYLSGMVGALEARGHEVEVITAGQVVQTTGYVPA